MKDVLFYYNYVSVGDIITITLCILVLFLLKSTYAVRKRNLSIFQVAVLCILVSSMASIIYHRQVLAVTPQNIPLIYFLRGITYSGLIGTYACFFIYIRNLVEMKDAYVKIFRITIIGVAVAGNIYELVGPYFKLGFYIDENLTIHQNYYTDIFRWIYIYYSISMAILLFAYRKKFIGKMLRCIAQTMGLAVVLVLYQDQAMQTTYLSISFMYPIFAVLVLYHHNSYDSETGMMDQHAFEAYAYDMYEKEFSMIFLSIPEITRSRLNALAKEFFSTHYKFLNYSCIFHLPDNRIAMVYEKKNSDPKRALERLYDGFMKIYTKNKLDFRIVMVEASDRLRYGDEYLSLCVYIEKNMPPNTIKTCDDKDMTEFLRAQYILEELKDIYMQDNPDDERVKVFCQPVLNTKTNQFTTAEALMRLELPQLGMVFPDRFIGMAEKYGYIHVLSKIILHKSCRYIRQFEEQGYYMERVSINFSMQELHLDSFCDDVIDIIRSNGVAYDKIAIELTESRNEKDFKNVKRIMKELQGYGIKFYLDDFGTGYSNFERIIGLPIDIIKFDRSMTILAGKNEQSRFMVGSFSKIFKRADYQILFEGIEDEKDEQQCIEMDALYLQGYKYSKPIPMGQLEEFLAKR